MKKNRVYLIVIVFIGIVSGAYFYIYKSHRDIGSEKGSYLVSALSIYDEFKKDETKSNDKYLDRTIEVSGKISSMDVAAKVIVLDNKLTAVFKDKIPADIKNSPAIKIKGRFIGYDDLLEELKMDQCVIINP